ncbi:translocation/assembly module TamB domain-containing protein [Legionella sp.]|uniref:translocation/assembly module TamB domain-containing protein n=1 Tax=Legionella sp. TaxID=459 RepID=UPI00321FAD35
MRNVLSAVKTLIKSLAVLFVVLGGLFLFLLTTTPGLFLTMQIAKIILPGKLIVEEPQGRLIHDFSLNHLNYQNNQFAINLEKFNLNWRWQLLFKHKLFIETLRAQSLSVVLKEDNARSDKKAPIKLPINMEIKDASIDRLTITQNESNHQFSNLKLKANLTNKLWQINQFNVDFSDMNFAISGQAQPIFPYPLSGSLQLKSKSQSQKIEGFLKVGGDFSLYHWHGEMRNPKGTIINGTLRYGKEIHHLATWHQFIWPIDNDQTFESSDGSLQIEGTFPHVNFNFASVITSPIRATIQLNGQTTNQSLQTQGTIKIAHPLSIPTSRRLPAASKTPSPSLDPADNARDEKGKSERLPIKFLEGEMNIHLVYDEKASPKIQGQVLAKSVDLVGTEQPIQQLKWNTALTGNSLDDLSLDSALTTQYFGRVLAATLHYQNHQVNGQASLGENQLQIKGSIPYQWQLKAFIPYPSLLHPHLKNLQTGLTANATITSPTQGEMNLTIQPGKYQLSEEDPAAILPFTGGQIHADLNSTRLQVKGNLILDHYKSLLLNLDLPSFRLDEGLSANQPIKGNLNLNVNSLAFLENFSEAATQLDGQLNALLLLKGTIDKPVIEGTLHLDKAKLLIPKIGLNLNPIEIHFQSRNKRWTSQGTIASQNKVLYLKGNGDFTPEMTGSLTLNGDDFPLIKTDEYLINLSPQLVIYFKPNAMDMTGRILIPNAQIKPQNFTSTISLSEDAVFIGPKSASSPNPLPINTDIYLDMGENVAIDVKGLRGFLTGNIRLRQLPQGPLNASGELNVRDGKYQAYGQDLAIDQGQLIFTGGSIDNPGINIRAVRRFNNSNASFSGSNQLFDFNSANLQKLDFGNEVTVGIEVSGRLSSPKIQLFSDPSSLSQADILSMLLLGKPANQANKAGGQLLLNAISSMKLGAGTRGTQLLSQLKQALGVDLDIKSNTKYNQQTNQITESSSVVVGKSITKRIYVSYNFGLAQADSNVFTLTYLLNKFLSIQVNASLTASGVDLLYTRETQKE